MAQSIAADGNLGFLVHNLAAYDDSDEFDTNNTGSAAVSRQRSTSNWRLACA